MVDSEVIRGHGQTIIEMHRIKLVAQQRLTSPPTTTATTRSNTYAAPRASTRRVVNSVEE